jgi:hypothetical protein
MAMSHSPLDIKFVGTTPGGVFEHRFWRRSWQHYGDGIQRRMSFVGHWNIPFAFHLYPSLPLTLFRYYIRAIGENTYFRSKNILQLLLQSTRCNNQPAPETGTRI